jgi:ribosomal protein S21
MNRDNRDKPDRDAWSHKKGLTVQVWNGNVNKALSQLKKRVATEGIAKELRKRKNFETNTAQRRRAMAEAKSRWRKKQAQIAGLETGKRKPRDR